MARKTKADAQETRAAILDAAVLIFSVQGVSRTTLADIAQQAGVTRGAIYWHFANKADLLNALWDQVLLPYEPLVQASESQDEPDPLGRMREVMIGLFNGLAEDPHRRQVFRILLDKCEAIEDTGTVHQRRANCHLDGFQRIETVLSNAIDKGQLPATIDVRLGAIAVISYVDGLMANYLMMPELFAVPTEAPIFIDGLVAMLRTGAIRRHD